MSCIQQSNNQNLTTEEYLKLQAQIEDQVDYQFIQRIIQEVTQSCALPLPIPASSIPPLIYQAASYFWENYDFAAEERYYCLKNSEFQKCGPNRTVKLPERIIGVFGVYKTTDSFNYGVMGDFSLERMILNNSALASGAGGSLSDVFGSGTGYNLTDVTGALYEVATYKAMFDTPLTFNYNPYSKTLASIFVIVVFPFVPVTLPLLVMNFISKVLFPRSIPTNRFCSICFLFMIKWNQE